LKEIVIALPPWPSLRRFYTSFLHLVDQNVVELRQQGNSVIVRSQYADVREELARACQHARELLKGYTKGGKMAELPLSGNDKRWVIVKLRRLLQIGGSIPISEVLESYAQKLPNENPEDLKKALAEFTGEGELALLSALNLDFYGYTRGPFFDGKYELDVRLNIHQMMICLAGYFAARNFRVRVGDEYMSVLIFPLDLGITKYDFYRTLRKNVTQLPGIKPEEGLVLWMLLNLPSDFPDCLVMGVYDPGGQSTASVGATIPIQLTNIRARASSFLAKLQGQNDARDTLIGLLRRSFQKGRETQADVDDAIQYVKLLYLAIQNFEREGLELLLRSSRIETLTASSQHEVVKRRHSIARKARYIASRFIVSG